MLKLMTKEKLSLKGIFTVLKNTVTGFIDDEVMSLCGALSYATIFSLAPFAVVLLTIVTFFYGDDAIQGQVFSQLSNYMGADVALQIENLMKNASLSGKSTMAAIIGGGTLIFGATTVFAQIQSSLNKIWGIKPKPKKGWIKMILNRLLSFSLILSVGFLLIVSFGLNAVLDLLSQNLSLRYENVQVYVFQILNQLVTFSVLTFLFGFIFKILPDAKIKLRDVIVGAMVTSLLFMIGKVLITYYVQMQNFDNTFGSAATVVILLVWIYYSSLILYFGAEFTKCWAVKFGYNIYPDEYAVTTKVVEVENAHLPVEDINKETVKANQASDVTGTK